MCTRKMRLRAVLLFIGLVGLCLAPTVAGQTVRAQATGAVLTEEALAGLPLRSIGPAVMGGRINDLAVVEDRPWIFYVASASGGLWKTENAGTTWRSVFDDQPVASIGDVTLAPSDPDVVWVGTGEANNRQSSTFGNGVYRSLDGGRSWSHLGLEDTQHIGRIAVHPADPDTAWVAALGHLWGANEQRGVFRTRDGGRTWERVLFVDVDTGVTDLVLDPVNPKVLYAAAYQRRRTPWGFAGGGAGSGLYRSVDGGDSWERLAGGLPEGPLGRIGLDIHRADPRVVYATVEHADQGGIYRSSDRGATWEKVNDLNPRPMYYSQIRVDPGDERRIYVLGAPFYSSSDGGRSFDANDDMTPSYDVGVHGDHHALWIDPANGDHLLLGGDGGLYVSWDRARSWDKIDNLPIAQFYAIGVDMRTPYWVYGGAQDTHSWAGPSATHRRIGVLNGDWVQTNFGDGMFQQPDPNEPGIVYNEAQGGSIARFDSRTGDLRSIGPEPPQGESYRFHWTSPIHLSPHQPGRLYLGGNRLFISDQRGDAWTPTKDLTRGEDRDELEIMGSVPDDTTLSRHDGTSNWGTITTIAESPLTPGVLWVGTDDGIVQLSRDGGTTWTRIDGPFPGLDPFRTLVSRVVASRVDEARAYVSFDRHRLDDFAPYLFVTDDYGASWRALGGGLPEAGWVNVVVEHPEAPDLLLAGTETGLFASIDRGAGWARITGGLPTVAVDDLVIHPRDGDLVVATHGRAIWVLDDLSPLAQLANLAARGESLPAAALFAPRPAVEYIPWKHESYGGQRQFVGANPPFGALITYWLGDAGGAETLELTIRDQVGTILWREEGDLSAGMHRAAWDLRAAVPGAPAGSRGPLVPPGLYTVQMNLAGEISEAVLEVRVDEAVTGVTVEQHRQRYEFLREVSAIQTTVAAAVGRVESLIEQVDAVTASAGSEIPPDLEQSLSDARGAAAAIRERLRGGRGFDPRSRALQRVAAGLWSALDGDAVRQGTFSPPTAAERESLRSLSEALDEQLAELEALQVEQVPALNQRIAAVGLAWVRPGDPIRRR